MCGPLNWVIEGDNDLERPNLDEPAKEYFSTFALLSDNKKQMVIGF